MKYLITNIKFDTDGEYIDDLPETLEINVPNNITDEDEIDEYLSDKISDITGWCHKGFCANVK